jgi:alpha-tubulin suppressor-like RCC1 family protein
MAIEGGDRFSMALDASGRVWVWGFDDVLGNFGTGNREPTLVQFEPGVVLTSISAFAGANHRLALDSLGQLWAWGAANNFGKLGNGSEEKSSIPVKVDQSAWDGARAVQMAVGNLNTLALDENGRLWVWGRLGLNGQPTASSTPVRVDDSALGDDPWRP